MFTIEESHIQAHSKVASLCWDGDLLVDWVAGGHRYHLDGRVQPRLVSYSFGFDSAVLSPSGEYAAIFVRLGTKGLLLHRGTVVRELNRSFYHANAFEYPIALLRLKSGQEIIAHCPDHYNQLELEDLVSGRRIADNSSVRTPTDYFFSRLAATSDGTLLLSAGWHWHPVDHVKVFNLDAALTDPRQLDGEGVELDTWADDSSAAFTEENRLIVALNDDVYDDDPDDEPSPRKEQAQEPFGVFRVYDPSVAELLWSSRPRAEVGTIMPVGETHAVGFYDHPKLFDLRSGELIHSWPHLKSGKQKSGITWGSDALPPMALDARHMRFAIANEARITVIQLKPVPSE